MADIIDYLKWRGDLPFSADPFNDVDNLILSELSYAKFDGIVPPDGRPVSIRILFLVACSPMICMMLQRSGVFL
ncbi:MAG: hypothetical protein II668_05510 [Oscillospiraceae bacterium]|nr:hypothetical protein [Oscillospiraceae bacterium]